MRPNGSELLITVEQVKKKPSQTSSVSEGQAGYLRVPRRYLNSDRWLAEPFTRGQAWLDLVGLATHRDRVIRIHGQRFDLKRGQVVGSLVDLAKRWKWSRNRVKRFLDELKTDHEVECQVVEALHAAPLEELSAANLFRRRSLAALLSHWDEAADMGNQWVEIKGPDADGLIPFKDYVP